MVVIYVHEVSFCWDDKRVGVLNWSTDFSESEVDAIPFLAVLSQKTSGIRWFLAKGMRGGKIVSFPIGFWWILVIKSSTNHKRRLGRTRLDPWGAAYKMAQICCIKVTIKLKMSLLACLIGNLISLFLWSALAGWFCNKYVKPFEKEKVRLAPPAGIHLYVYIVEDALECSEGIFKLLQRKWSGNNSRERKYYKRTCSNSNIFKMVDGGY